MNKKTFVLILILFIGVFSASSVRALSSPDGAAKKYGITFPVAELGNCADYTSCRTYCDDPTNHEACVSFAKQKGFYKENKVNTQKQELLNNAKTELGCDTAEACKALCQKEENFTTCSQFAKKYSLGNQQKDPGKQEIIQKAKELLGCDSEISCRALCEQEANREKCSSLAKQTGLRGGTQPVGSGGKPRFGSDSAGFKPPLNSSMEARQHNYDELCKKYPEKCKMMYPSGKPPIYNRDELCKLYPEKCQRYPSGAYPPPTGTYDPAAKCSAYGCTWTGTTCQCRPISPPPPSGETVLPPQEVKGVSTIPSPFEKIFHFLFGFLVTAHWGN